jgi:hypothetical protein
MGYEIFMVFKEMTLGVPIVFIPKSLSWYKDHTACPRLLCAFWWGSYLLEDVYEIFILCYWRPLSVEHHNSGSINLDTEQDLVIAIDTHIQIKCWIYLLSNWRDKNRAEVLTWSCTATEWMYKYAAYPRPWIHCSRFDLAIYLHYSHL